MLSVTNDLPNEPFVIAVSRWPAHPRAAASLY